MMHSSILWKSMVMFFLFAPACFSMADDGAVDAARKNQEPETFIQVGHTSEINAVEFSPDGRFILTGGDDDTIKLWEAQSSRLIRTFKDNDNVVFISFLPGGDSFFSVNDKSNICIWKIKTGEKLHEFSLGDFSISSVDTVTYDGKRLRAIVGLRLYEADVMAGTIGTIIERPKSAPVTGYLGFGFGFRNAVGKDGRLMLSSVRDTPNENLMKSKHKTMMLWEISTGRILSTLSGHSDIIDTMALTDDHRYALSGSRDKTVRLWDLRRGQAAAVFTGHQHSIEAVALSPDQKYVLSGSRDQTMKLWDVRERKEIASFAHDCSVTFVGFSPDGRSFISGDDNGAVRFWDVKSRQLVKSLKSDADRISAFASSADGKRLLTGSSTGRLRVWDAATGRLLRTIDAHRERISAVASTKDGNSFISACYDKTLKLWDANTGTLQTTFTGHPGQVYKAVVSPDGSHVLSSSQGGDIRLWSLKTGEQRLSLTLPQGLYLWSIGFSDDSRSIIIAHSQKTTGHTVKILALSGREVKSYTDVSFGGYSDTGRYFLSRDYKDSTGKEEKLFSGETKTKKLTGRKDEYNVRDLVDISRGSVLGRFGRSGAFVYLSLTADGKALTKNRLDTDIRLIDLRDGREIRRFPAIFGLITPDATNILAPAGKRMQVYDPASGEVMKTFDGEAAGTISSMALSAKGGYAMSGDASGSIQFWDVESGSLMRSIKAEAGDLIQAVAFSPDNRYAASMAIFGTVKIWDMRDGRQVSEFKSDYHPAYYDEVHAGQYMTYGVGAFAFSPDGRRIACGSKLWDAARGAKVLNFQTPNGPGYWISFSPDGAYLLSKNMLWDTATGRRIKKWDSLKGGSMSVFSADANYIYSIDDEGALSIVETDSGKLVRRFADYVAGSTFDVSVDGKVMISSDSESNALTVWDLASSKKRAAIPVNRPIGSLSISSDAGIATANHWVSAGRYDLRQGREVAQFVGFADGEWIVITPEGYYNASAAGDRYVNVRVGDRVYGIENFREAFFRPDLVKVALTGGSLNNYRKLDDVKQPPAVAIVDTPSRVREDELTVKLRLEDQGGGIGDVRLYLNGSAVVMESRGVSIKGKGDGGILKTFRIKLSSGKNIVKAVAFNGDNSMQSNESLHEVMAEFSSSGKTSLTALIIGINDFKNPKLTLQYPVADAELFAQTLEAASRDLFEKVTIRKLTKKDETTNEAIIREMKTFRTLRPDDLFVFYIASHGTVDDGEYFLITSNVGSLRTEKLRTDAISQNALKEAIANIPATKKLVIIDTCNAGALGEAIQSTMMTRGMSEDTALKILSRAMGSTILSASTSMQEAMEGYRGHGLFTYVLAEGLKGKADKGKTGYVRTTELADYVDNEVPLLAEKAFKRAQYPTISISGQAFPIGKTK